MNQLTQIAPPETLVVLGLSSTAIARNTIRTAWTTKTPANALYEIIFSRKERR